jgi:hypothetical protein
MLFGLHDWTVKTDILLDVHGSDSTYPCRSELRFAE